MVNQFSILKDRITLSNQELSKKYKGRSNSKIILPWMSKPSCSMNEGSDFLTCEEYSDNVLKRVYFSSTNESNKKTGFVRALYTTQFQLNNASAKKVASHKGVCKSIGKNEVLCQIKDIRFAADEPSKNIEKAFAEEMSVFPKIIP